MPAALMIGHYLRPGNWWSTGNMVPHPLTKIATQAARDLCRYACEFGMTPAARARARAGWDPDSGPGKFDGLLA
jgi:phage terminase small subunit